jgi:hypothetical protein
MPFAAPTISWAVHQVPAVVDEVVVDGLCFACSKPKQQMFWPVTAPVLTVSLPENALWTVGNAISQLLGK